MTTLPTWAVYLVALGTPLLTLLGVVVAQAVIRSGAGELETRSRREETFRVRWAAELAVSDDEGKANLGVYELNALADSALLDDAQSLFVNAALSAVVDTVSDQIEETGDDVQVMAVEDPDRLRMGRRPTYDQVTGRTRTTMAKKFFVTAAQKNAAEGLARRAEARGETLRPAVSKIANAKTEPVKSK